MKVFFDTNVLIDVLAKRGEFYQDSAEVLKMCEIGKTKGFISSLSIANIMHIYRKLFTKAELKKNIMSIAQILEVIPLTQKELTKAFSLNFDDYEDGVQFLTAKSIKADYIITRDIRDFQHSTIKALTPAQFMNLNK